MKRILGAALLALCLAGGPALAGDSVPAKGAAPEKGLPQDVPVSYPALEMDAAATQLEATPSDAGLELDERAVSPDAPVPTAKPAQTKKAPVRPGDRPQQGVNSITIQTVSDITFDSPYAEGEVNVGNPEGSQVNVQYMLRISLAELERQTGRTGYDEEELAALAAQPGFDPETTYIPLSQTKGIPPGSVVRTMTLGTLPDGSTIPAGDYSAQMVMAAYDALTNRRSMVGAVVEVKFHVLSGDMRLSFDADGTCDLYAFNPVTSAGDVMFAIQISQQELMDVSGEAHRTAEETAAQQANPAFDPAYEFLTIYESDPVAPGAFLEGRAALRTLPDGQALPAGEYTAWLVRYAYDAQWNSWQMEDASTQLTLSVPEPTGKAGGIE